PRFLTHLLPHLFVVVPGGAAACGGGYVNSPFVPVAVHETGLALGGHDPVAYFTQGRPVVGSPEHQALRGSVTYRFASLANLQTFQREPDRHAPRYGGFCAYGMSLGKKFPSDPRAWRIVEGRLYLNKDFDVQATWLKDLTENIASADGHWPRVERVPAEEL
ncbi:MAG: YHS domain-containing (seleno)protein, partial [Acidobacteriota bacterium]